MTNITTQKNSSHHVFDGCPEFYLNDNRKNRHFNPVTKEMLEEKLTVLLPPEFIKGKSILDLGSCLGAAGQWALFHGASSYTGVELQQSYAAQSEKLLTPWSDRARIYQQDISSFLGDEKGDSFDVILMAGVIYLFVDNKAIIDHMCRVAKEAVVIETNYPPCIRRGKLPPHAAITEYIYNQEVNLADENESLLGISATSSLQALDLMFGLNGFGKNEPKLNFPKTKSMLNYSNEGIYEKDIPLRLAVCYMKNESIIMKTLADNLPHRKGFRRSWQHDPASKKRTRARKEIAQQLMIDINPWKFDENVASQFLEIAEREIPDYQRVIDKTVQTINKCDFTDPKIIDIGSAIGETLERLHEEGYGNLYGVDNSRAMLNRSFNKATLIHSDTFPIDHSPFDVVIANWVLHFIDQREAYLQAIKSALSHHGIFILTEKLMSSSLAHSLYDQFKHDNGMTTDEINKKRKQLKGILTPYSLAWYLKTLEEAGFDSIDIINANSVFVTFLIQQNRVDGRDNQGD